MKKFLLTIMIIAALILSFNSWREKEEIKNQYYMEEVYGKVLNEDTGQYETPTHRTYGMTEVK